MLTRRDFQLALSSTVLLHAIPSFAQADDIELESAFPPLPGDLASLEGQPPVADYGETALVGVQRPKSEEIATAEDVLLKSPNDTDPITVATYFYELGQGKYGADRRAYAREWPIRANPVIHNFFTATRTFPEGDVTPWCAAFINWCIARALATDKDMIGRTPDYYVKAGKPFPNSILAKTSKSAASGSFRCFPIVEEPARGDIVVWRKPGSDNMTRYCAGQGHVAFFIAKDGAKLRVLGGNQSDGMSGGAVTLARWPRTRPGTHDFHGYRSWKRA